jgi:hypothetical protein
MSAPILPHVFSAAFATDSMTVPDVRVRLIKEMPALASILASVDGGDAPTAAVVLGSGDRLKVSRINTQRHTTKVINRKSSGNLSHEVQV